MRDFDGSFIPDVVQQRAHQAFVPTVQAFIAAILANPAYKDEFGSGRSSSRGQGAPAALGSGA